MIAKLRQYLSDRANRGQAVIGEMAIKRGQAGAEEYDVTREAVEKANPL